MTVPRLSVDPTGTHLLRDGEPFVLVTDTVWSAFADAAEADWRMYTARRREQGFTGLAISVLPILHDRTVRPGAREPFAVRADGTYDYSAPSDAYFAQAKELVRIAADEGLAVCLVVLWANYVVGTMASGMTPGSVMPDDDRRRYVDLVAETFAGLDPVFVISGDDGFVDPRTGPVYAEVLDQIAASAPDSLTTTHTLPEHVLPDAIADSPHLGFYAYQSGHDVTKQDLCWTIAADYLARPVRRPIVNLEPLYEQHGRVNGVGRFSRDDVRRATWLSIVGGATAGIGYGAHGLFSWHDHAGTFLNRKGTREPFPWQIALGFAGALDAAFAGALIRDLQLWQTLPAQELSPSEHLRVAATPDRSRVVVYVPFADEFELTLDLSGYRARGWDLAERTPVDLRILLPSRIAQVDLTGDALVVLERR